MAVQIRRATKKRAKLRMNIEAQPGGGKTYSSLLIGKCLIGEPPKLPEGQRSKIVLLDTERNSSELYADEFDFEVIELTDHDPKAYVAAIRAAEEFGAEVVIVDSTTHEWKWCLSRVDVVKAKFGGNKWSAWSEIRPPHDDFVDAMMSCRAHLIATTRAKPATAQEQGVNGEKTKVVKLGLEGIQDDMIEFAFGVVMRMDAEHNGIITKTRCRALDGKVFKLPGEQLAAELRRWLDSGDPLVEVPLTLDAAIAAGVKLAMNATTEEQKKAAWAGAREFVVSWCKGHGRSSDEAKGAVDSLKARIVEARGGKPGPATPQDMANGSGDPSSDSAADPLDVIARDLGNGITRAQVVAVQTLLARGDDVVRIVRYKRDQTGGIDDEVLVAEIASRLGKLNSGAAAEAKM
jgi:hypothetical protein